MSDEVNVEIAEPEAGILDPKWSEYVLSKFTENELVNNTYPTNPGLRRVIQLLIGKIYGNSLLVVKAPTEQDRSASVVVTMSFQDKNTKYVNSYSDAADVSPANTEHPFNKHCLGSAVTRTESRIMRKVLCLNTISAEEIGAEQGEEVVSGELQFEKANSQQISMIDVLCKRNNVDAQLLLNSASKKYTSIKDIEFAAAVKFIEHLNKIQQKTIELNPAIKGYKSDWRESFK